MGFANVITVTASVALSRKIGPNLPAITMTAMNASVTWRLPANVHIHFGSKHPGRLKDFETQNRISDMR